MFYESCYFVGNRLKIGCDFLCWVLVRQNNRFKATPNFCEFVDKEWQ
jgi:hypothetical protein